MDKPYGSTIDSLLPRDRIEFIMISDRLRFLHALLKTKRGHFDRLICKGCRYAQYRIIHEKLRKFVEIDVTLLSGVYLRDAKTAWHRDTSSSLMQRVESQHVVACVLNPLKLP